MKLLTSNNFKEIWLKLFLIISPSNKSTVMNFKNEALWRYRVTMVQNGGFPVETILSNMLISNMSMSKVQTFNYNKLSIILKHILFSLQQNSRFELTSLMSEPVLQGDVFLTQYCIGGKELNSVIYRYFTCTMPLYRNQLNCWFQVVYIQMLTFT